MVFKARRWPGHAKGEKQRKELGHEPGTLYHSKLSGMKNKQQDHERMTLRLSPIPVFNSVGDGGVVYQL